MAPASRSRRSTHTKEKPEHPIVTMTSLTVIFIAGTHSPLPLTGAGIPSLVRTVRQPATDGSREIQRSQLSNSKERPAYGLPHAGLSHPETNQEFDECAHQTTSNADRNVTAQSLQTQHETVDLSVSRPRRIVLGIEPLRRVRTASEPTEACRRCAPVPGPCAVRRSSGTGWEAGPAPRPARRDLR
jgi:hypothetical protein